MAESVTVDDKEYEHLREIEDRLDGCINRTENGPPCIDKSYDESILKILNYIKSGQKS